VNNEKIGYHTITATEQQIFAEQENIASHRSPRGLCSRRNLSVRLCILRGLAHHDKYYDKRNDLFIGSSQYNSHLPKHGIIL
jgi:hypothetical protein